MKRHRTNLVAVIAILITTTTGCKDDDQRLVEMAERHEERQAEQTQRAIQLQQGVAEGTRRLIEADGKAREELLALQRDVQAERSSLNSQRDDLNAERRELAASRRFDSLVAAAIANVGLLLACIAPLGLAWYLLRQPESTEDPVLVEAMLDDMVSQHPRLFVRDIAGIDSETPRRLEK